MLKQIAETPIALTWHTAISKGLLVFVLLRTANKSIIKYNGRSRWHVHSTPPVPLFLTIHNRRASSVHCIRVLQRLGIRSQHAYDSWHIFHVLLISCMQATTWHSWLAMPKHCPPCVRSSTVRSLVWLPRLALSWVLKQQGKEQLRLGYDSLNVSTKYV